MLTNCFNPLGLKNADMRFVADFPDKAEMSLNYSAFFDRTDKSNTPFESVRGLLFYTLIITTKLCAFEE